MDLVDLFVAECGRIYDRLGGHLVCEVCGRVRGFKRPAEDWPVCCRRPMGWWTAAEVEAGTREQSTGQPGPRPDRRKWSPQQVDEIVELHDDGVPIRQIARRTGVPRSTVGLILQREAA